MPYFVYIMTNTNDTVLYVGVTNDLVRRVVEHKQKMFSGFSARYNLCKLVYFEETEEIYSAITREKQIKGWSRMKKLGLILQKNPGWYELGIESD